MMLRLILAIVVCVLWASGPARADERWLLVTDIHLNPFDPRDYPAFPGRDTNTTLFRESLAAMKRTVPNPTVVLLGGDFLAHHFPERSRGFHGSGLATQDAIATMKSIAAAFNRAYPHAHFAVALGNNDDPCGDYRSEYNDNYMAALARIWKPLVDRDAVAPGFAQTFSRGGYSEVPVMHGRVRIMTLNSVYWSFFYRGACSRLPRNPGLEEHEWMQRTLAATPPNVRTVVLTHIPPGVDPQSTLTAHRVVTVPFLHGGDDRALADIFQQSGNRIAWMVVGHAHRNDVRLVGGVPVLIASSISPVYRNGPAFFVLDVTDDGSLRDIDTYVYDYDRDDWDRAPSFDTAWKVKGFTAEAVRSIHDRLAVDPDLREMWAERYTAWGWRIDDIDETTWRVYWCAQTEQSGGAFEQCAGTTKRVTAFIIAAVALAVCIVVAIGAIVWSLVRRRSRRFA